MRWLKIFGWIALAIGVLAVAGGFALTQVVDPNSFRDDIERAVRNATGRELRIRGDLGLDWFPWLAVTLRDSELAGPAGMPAPVSWREAHIGARLWPLLRGRLEIDRIGLVGLRLQLERNQKGVANWTATSTPVAAAARRERPLRIAGLDIKGAQLDYRDRSKMDSGQESRWQFCALDLKTDEISPNASIKARGSLRWMRKPAADCAQAGSNEASVPGEFAARLLLAKQGFELRDLLVRHFGSGYELHAPLLTADLTKQTYRAERWQALGKDLKVQGEGLSIAVRDGALVKAIATIERANPRALAKAAGFALPDSKDPNALSALRGKIEFIARDSGWELRAPALELDDVRLNGRLRGGTNLPMEFEWQADALKLDGYLPPRDPAAPPFKFPRDTLHSLQARGRLAVRKLQWLDVTAHDAVLAFELRDGELRAVPESDKP